MFLRNRNGAFWRLMSEDDGSNQGGGSGGNAPPATFTQEQVNALLAKERRSQQAKVDEVTKAAQATAERLAELEANAARLAEEKELEGKSALEKLEHKHKKDLELANRQLEESRKAIAERDALAAKTLETLNRERVANGLVGYLGKAGVIPERLSEAVRYSMIDFTDVKVGEDGTITGSYGDLVEKPLAELSAAWAASHDNFLPAPKGGAGTRPSNGNLGSRSLADMSLEEMASIAGASGNQ